jgi:hypothetical protein
MKKLSILFAAVIILILTSKKSQAQCDTIANICKKHLSTKYLSDGQSYRALLVNQEVAEFHSTLFGGTTYRFAACSGTSDGNLVFSVFDKERNLLFTNSEYKNSPYWDFKVNSSLDCIIETQLNAKTQTSGCAVLLIGFKPQQ